MAKIDLNAIPGYQDMSAEEKLAALEGLELPDPDYSGFVRKETADKYASEAAKYKKQLRERMSEEEAAKAQQDEERAQFQQEIADLRRERAIDKNTAKLLSLGYAQDMAAETAVAMFNNDWETIFNNQAKFHEQLEKKIKADLLKDTPTPPAGGGEVKLDYTSLIADAQKNGNYSAMAYYTRLQEQQLQKMK